MSIYFYGDSPHAVTGTKVQLLEHVAEASKILNDSGMDLKIVGVNKLYKFSFICNKPGDSTPLKFRIYKPGDIRQEGKLYGYGGDPWEAAPNFVKVEEIELGQMELDL